MNENDNAALESILKLLIEQGPQAMAEMFTTVFNLAMRLEREQFLNAATYERSSDRLGYANGTKPKKVDTQASTLTLDISKIRESKLMKSGASQEIDT